MLYYTEEISSPAVLAHGILRPLPLATMQCQTLDIIFICFNDFVGFDASRDILLACVCVSVSILYLLLYLSSNESPSIFQWREAIATALQIKKKYLLQHMLWVLSNSLSEVINQKTFHIYSRQ